MRPRSNWLLVLWLFAALAQAQPSLDVVKRLREGGYVLYMRHASTDFSQNDASMSSFEDCAHQRNLTDKGRDEARAVGEQIKRLRLPEREARGLHRAAEGAREHFAHGDAQALDLLPHRAPRVREGA